MGLRVRTSRESSPPLGTSSRDLFPSPILKNISCRRQDPMFRNRWPLVVSTVADYDIP
jgi:hypothetical protein